MRTGPDLKPFQTKLENSRDAHTPQSGEIVFNTMRYIEVVKQYKDQDTFRAVSVI